MGKGFIWECRVRLIKRREEGQIIPRFFEKVSRNHILY